MSIEPDTGGGRIAVALSGGGHRAALFGLGALLYLADAGKGPSLASIASVSGGSFANGAVAQSLDLTSADPAELEQVATRVATLISRRGTVFGAWQAVAYVSFMALAGLAALAALLLAWLLPLAPGLQALVLVVSVLALAGLASLRGRVCVLAYDRTLFRPDGKSTRLGSIHDGLDHVFCATDLHAGEDVYFSRRFVSSYRFGRGVPGDLPLSAAVQASAAFPGAFPVAWLPTRRHAFAGGAEPAAAKARWMALVDGGVYDNMAEQWARGMEERLRRDPDRDAGFRDAEELVIVNSSAGLEWSDIRSLRIPVLGELLTLLRDKSVLYDNGNSLRRQGMVDRFELAQRSGEGLRGALVHISQSPFRVPRAFHGRGGERAERAEAALEALLSGAPDAEERWAEDAKANAAVATTLVPFDAATSARLLHHAYVLAMVNLHVILGHPLLDLPDRSRFERMCGGRPR